MLFKDSFYFVNPYGFGFKQEVQTILHSFPAMSFWGKFGLFEPLIPLQSGRSKDVDSSKDNFRYVLCVWEVGNQIYIVTLICNLF